MTGSGAPSVAAAVDLLLARAGDCVGAMLVDPVIVGSCNVCGTRTGFVWRRQVMARESLSCLECLTTSRYRSLARGLLWAIRELAGIDAPSLAQLPRSGPRLRVYDTQIPFSHPPFGAYPLPRLLADTGWIEVHTSRYRPDEPMGAAYGPMTTNQNLEALTFADDAFDLLITSDVMEHVRLDGRAHREISRVLRPGGIYLFTVPHSRAMSETLSRVLVRDVERPETDEHLLEPEYHGSADANEQDGVLSYRVYGTDIDQTLRSLGFTVDYWIDQVPEHAILDTELFVCRLASRSEPAQRA